MPSVMDEVEAMQQDVVMSEADINEAATGDLIPTGTYEGIVTKYELKPVKKEDSPFYGKPNFLVETEVYVEGQPKVNKFFVCPVIIKVDDKTRSESKLAAQLVRSTGSVGQPFSHALDAAKAMRLRYRVRLSPAKGQWDARNWTDAITVPEKSE